MNMKLFAFLVVSLFFLMNCQPKDPEGDWISLFDGSTLKGWTANENQGTWKVEDGAIVCEGERSHLFYSGEANGGNFKNFEFKADVMTMPGSNSGIYICTEYQDEGWPSKGYEVQINNSFIGNPQNPELKKTAGLYGIRNKFLTTVDDEEWFTMHIILKKDRIQILVNDQLITDYTEPEDPYRPESMASRLIGEGSFALQGHDPGSRVYFKNIQVRPLPDDAEFEEPQRRLDRDTERYITELHATGFPIMDLHVHLKGDLTMKEALSQSRYKGIDFGIAVNCGKAEDFPINNDTELMAYLDTLRDVPAFNAMQAEGREWVDIFSMDAVNTFDYVFTDAMTYKDAQGVPVQMWKADQLERIDLADPETFMDGLVEYIVQILNEEPVDIYVNATYIPDPIVDRYDELWTEERMKKVIQAAIDNEIAIEISARLKMPNYAFIRLGKEMGAKFTFGTNNIDSNLGHLEYCLEAIEACGLTAADMWVPGYEDLLWVASKE
jgi:hypothetical protein